MDSEAVFKIIDVAKQVEDKTGNFQQLMQGRVPELHLTIGLHDDQPVLSLVKFAIEYIEMAPRVLECVEVCAKEAHSEELFAPFLATALNYFIHPAIAFTRFQGLDGLLMKAYLCHRLLEEMYENNKSIRNSQLCTVEITQANLLAHQLIGEPFANELDESVDLTLQQLAGTPDYYELNLMPFVEQAQHQAWGWMREYWQNLLIRNHIQFHFSYRRVY
ncbi:MAG: hypothetical protein H6999_07020 [Hahellaceae bacterium]|nr:hypothetical protein [Hahellaceae bacterium]